MASHLRVAVYREHSNRPLFYVKFKVALALIEHKRAKFVGDGSEKSICLVSAKTVVKSSALAQCGQGDTYEKAAIERNRRYVTGGLTRTEHCPKPFNAFTGARVGHQ